MMLMIMTTLMLTLTVDDYDVDTENVTPLYFLDGNMDVS